MRVSDFHYDLPESSIAQAAVEPRHASRLLDTRDLTDHSFSELPDLLNEGDLLVVNETKVRAARLIGNRVDSGGRVEILLLEQVANGWEAMARPSRRLRPGVQIDCDGLILSVLSVPSEGVVRVSLDTENDERAIELVGEIPLPPYFTGRLENSQRYQTIFAAKTGSAAAPTAALHFTQDVLTRLRRRSIPVAKVDLHVSLDTFRPMSGEHVEEHRMHSEWCSVPIATAEAVAATKRDGGRVVAIGTTVVRTLESFADHEGRITPGETMTSLFLQPGTPIRVVDLLVTNFHLPSSTLLVLLAAFMGDGWRDVYHQALLRGYRFLSFGDAMLAQRQAT